jgi:hypothetical protein
MLTPVIIVAGFAPAGQYIRPEVFVMAVKIAEGGLDTEPLVWLVWLSCTAVWIMFMKT